MYVLIYLYVCMYVHVNICMTCNAVVCMSVCACMFAACRVPLGVCMCICVCVCVFCVNVCACIVRVFIDDCVQSYMLIWVYVCVDMFVSVLFSVFVAAMLDVHCPPVRLYV